MSLRLSPLHAAFLMAGLTPFAAQALNAPVVADSFTITSSSTINGGASALKIGPSNKTFLRFDLSGLPGSIVSSNVAKATLFFWVNNVPAAGALQISPVTSSWAEGTINGNLLPSLGVPSQINITAGSPSGYYVAVDVTAEVKDWVTTPATNYGLVIEPDAASTSTAVWIDSKENINTSHPAYIEISLTGPAGAKGATGATGTNGANGATGATGTNGANGATGATGTNGANGATGATGTNGANGATGATGTNGANGATGATGTNGANGATGATGTNGTNGANGATGATGTDGANGATGATGTNGANAFTTTSATFTQPATNSTVAVSVGNTAWMSVGQVVYVTGGGYYQVASITNATTAVLSNLGYAGNAATSANISSSASVSPAGLQGSTSGAVTSVGVTAPVVNTGTSSAPVIGIGVASGSSNGYLSSTDWTTFNSKGDGDITGVTAGTGLSGGGLSGSVTLSLANTPTTANTPSTLVLRDASGNFSAGVITADLTGNASTASILKANGSNCPSGQYPLGVDAGGNAEACTTPTGGGSGPAVYQQGSSTALSNAFINTGLITISAANTDTPATFGKAFNSTPICTISTQNTAGSVSRISALTTSTITVQATVIPAVGNGVHYHCIGN